MLGRSGFRPVYIEMPADLAEHLADLVGVYGAHDKACEQGAEQPMNPRVTKCRVCFVFEMETRIREAVRNERKGK